MGRLTALALSIVVVLVSADAAVHSVHHLEQGDSAGQCALAACFTQTAALTPGAVAVASPPAAAPNPALEATQRPPRVGASRPDRGRAPPSRPA
ncbi:MAG TPA: hypothetical protein VHZ49_19870 [Methylomirabilota bacterium]|jgi:hypothetical protein|nr:hypothetical protein [Methylomirabilota bacterium]